MIRTDCDKKNVFIAPLNQIGLSNSMGVRYSLVNFEKNEYSKFNRLECDFFSKYIASYRSGKYIPKSNYSLDSTGIVYLSVNNFTGPDPDYSDVVFLNDDLYNELSSLRLEDGDFVITRSGTIGHVHQVFLPDNRIYVPSHHLLVVKLNNKADANSFLKYWLRSSFTIEFLTNFAQGKSQKELTNWSVRHLPIPNYNFTKKDLLKIKEYENLLKDKKKKVLNTIEIINQVFSNMLGKDLCSIYDQYGKRSAFGLRYSKSPTSVNFFRELVNLTDSSNITMSPRIERPINNQIENYIRKTGYVELKELLEVPVTRGTQPKVKENDGDLIPVVKTAQLREDNIDIQDCDYSSRDNIKKKSWIKRNDILMASTGKGSIGKTGFVMNDDDISVDGHVSIIRLRESINKKYVLYYLQSILGVFQVEKKYSGATNQIELYPHQIERFLIVWPDAKKQAEIVNEIENCLQEQIKIRKEIQTIYDLIAEMIAKANRNI